MGFFSSLASWACPVGAPCGAWVRCCSAAFSTPGLVNYFGYFYGDIFSADAFEQLGNAHSQTVGNFIDALKRQVPLAPFYLPDVSPVQVTRFAHFLLGPVPRLPQLAGSLAKGSLQVFCHPESVIGQYLYF